MTASRLAVVAATVPVVALIVAAVAAIVLDRALADDDRLIRGVNA